MTSNCSSSRARIVRRRRGRVGGERGDRTVGRRRQAVAQRGDERRRRRAVARPEHAHLDARRPQACGPGPSPGSARHRGWSGCTARTSRRAAPRTDGTGRNRYLRVMTEPRRRDAGTVRHRCRRQAGHDPRTGRRGRSPWLRRPGQPGRPRQPGLVPARSPTSRRRIPFWTSIQPIYHSHPAEVAITAGHLAEVSGGRFRLGLGVSHAPAMERLGLDTGKPLSDMRTLRRGHPRRRAPGRCRCRRSTWPRCATRCSTSPSRSPTGRSGPTPRCSHMPTQVARIPADKRDSFFLADMVPDRDRRRQGRGPGDPPAHARRLRDPAELPQLLEGGRLRGRDGGDRGRPGRRRPGQARPR